MNQEIKNKKFIEKSVKKHGYGVFNYLNTIYINTTTQLCLICNKHSLNFKITPVSHLKGHGGCPICFKETQHLTHKNKKEGEKYKTNQGYTIEIIEYINSTNCSIRFEDGGILKNKNYCDVVKGQVKNPNHVIELGVGYNGIGKYKYSSHKYFYKKWYNMLNRCYNEKECFKTYKDVIVCGEWHNFQNFAQWFEENYNSEIMNNSWQLDKDILVKGNKIYSPETCCFIPQEINSLFIKNDRSRGDFPVGVSFYKSRGKYTSRISRDSKILQIGYFDTPEEAFQAYKIAKETYIKEVAEKWEGLITEQTYKAMITYQVEITD